MSFSSLPQNRVSRRRFLRSTATLAALTPLFRSAGHADTTDRKRPILKTLKIGMVGVDGSLTDKFQAAKDAGFDGIEMNSPGMDVAETRRAIEQSQLPVDGTVCSTHWKIRHSSPNRDQRAQALRDLETALRDTHAVGGNTALLVIGHGQDGPEDKIWKRSLDNIAAALPLAAELGVYIAIENVWNHFLYDHAGGVEQTAEKYVRYVDELNSPWVGMQFDIGNHWKYGSMGDWIRQLGRRIVKLDLKGFSRQRDKFTKIGAGDLDWADVRAALDEIGFAGWAAAEVGGGGPDRLREISRNMDHVFGLA